MSQNLSTISNFNLEQYLGIWYEIARLPMKHQPEDSTDISAVYSLNKNGKVGFRTVVWMARASWMKPLLKQPLSMQNMPSWKSVFYLKACVGFRLPRVITGY